VILPVATALLEAVLVEWCAPTQVLIRALSCPNTATPTSVQIMVANGRPGISATSTLTSTFPQSSLLQMDRASVVRQITAQRMMFT